MKDAITMAEWYIKIGWSLIPTLPDSKLPAIKWSEFQERRATLDEVTDWISKGWSLAVVTGDISGILVVDDDRVKHGLNEWGFDSSVVSKSQSHGKHYFFKYDRELHSHSNAQIRVDLKAWHSYCLLPPFGNREWVKKPSLENIKNLPILPDEIVRLINSDALTATGEKKPIVLSDFTSISDGGRNDGLYKVACSLFNKHSEDETIQILKGINQTYNPPLTEQEFNYQVSRAKAFVIDGVAPEEPTKSIKELIFEDNIPTFTVSTGARAIDDQVSFAAGNAYLIGGCEKSGKSALCMNIANHIMQHGEKIIYVNAEFAHREFINRMAGMRYEVPYSRISFDQRKEYVTEFEKKLVYMGVGIDSLDHELILSKVRDEAAKGTKIVFFDNVSKYANFHPNGKTDTEVQQYIMTELDNIAKELNVVVFVVLHTKDIPMEKVLTTRIKEIIDSKSPDMIFESSVSVMGKPSNADLYGGSRTISQFSGTILLWRPFQKFSDTKFNRRSLIILESFRSAPSAIEIPTDFFGEIPTFQIFRKSYEEIEEAPEEVTESEIEDL